MGNVTTSNYEDVFTYHPPRGDFIIEKYHRLRQAGKAAAKVVLDSSDLAERKAALEVLRGVIETECGDCRDRQESVGCLAAGAAFMGGVSQLISHLEGEEGGDVGDAAAAEMECTQAVISCIRNALMWANASVALAGRI